ncbi:MAG: hypothetical protein PVI90_00420 [Desulfobacteraceae bacterium]
MLLLEAMNKRITVMDTRIKRIQGMVGTCDASLNALGECISSRTAVFKRALACERKDR